MDVEASGIRGTMKLIQWALVALSLLEGAALGRGKSDLSLVIGSQELPISKEASTLPNLEDVVPDVLKANSVNGIEASLGAYADNDDVESFK